MGLNRIVIYDFHMGEQQIARHGDETKLHDFMQAVVRDVDALRYMLEHELFETGVTRIGAEQEFFLVNEGSRPARAALEILERLEDPDFTTELGLFNLELNLPPLTLGGDCLSEYERMLTAKVAKLRTVALGAQAQPVLTGILPTLRASDLVLDNMTPRRRYRALNDALKDRSGGEFELNLRGVDEVSIVHDSVMMESACTSFQLHFQVDPDDFARMYNIAQVAVAPVLAAATNAPLLFGRRLWSETRIPLFQQAVDTRGSRYYLREKRPRVRFGHHWLEDSIVELFVEDVASFRPLVSGEVIEDSLALLEEGAIPKLAALQVFGGTVYRWNRPCYGLVDGKPHLRIEMRALPSGPTTVDEVANAALFFGLMLGLSQDIGDVRDVMEFADARSNFYAAAQYGLEAQVRWLGQLVPARDLLLRDLVPMARQALARASLDRADIDRYLGIIEDRVASGRTGSQWLLDSAAALSRDATRDEVCSVLTAATLSRQLDGKPVHEWDMARFEEGTAMKPGDLRVEEFMTTDVFSVDPEESVSLAAHVMEWKHVRHVPVEEKGGKLVGLLSCFDVIRQYCASGDEGRETVAVKTVMNATPVTVSPETTMLEAMRLLREESADCLPVVRGEQLVGILTEHDFVHIAARLLQRGVGED